MLESGLSNGRIYPRTSADIRGWTDTDGRFEDTDGYGYFVYPSADIRINLHWIKLSQKDEKMVKILNEFTPEAQSPPKQIKFVSFYFQMLYTNYYFSQNSKNFLEFSWNKNYKQTLKQR